MMNWKQRFQRHSWAVQDQLTLRAFRQMEVAMQGLLEKAIDELIEKGSYSKPNPDLMYAVMERYYRKIVEQAYHTSQIAKEVQKPKMQSDKKSLAKLPLGIPNKLPPLVRFFSDKRTWGTIQKRSRKIVDRLRSAYFKKLDRKFAKIGPQLQTGEKSPKEVKDELRKAWKVTKSRVETLFRTETTNYFNKVQVSFFSDDEDIIGFLFQANRDSSTTGICRTRHGLVYRPGTKELKENTPACHYNCRSELIPLANIPGNRKMLEDPSRDPSKRRVTPLPPGWVAGRKQ